MHTWTSAGSLTVIHHNSDLSGDVMIHTRKDDYPGFIAVPGEDLLEFVADYVRTEKIRELEVASTRQCLGLPEETGGETIE